MPTPEKLAGQVDNVQEKLVSKAELETARRYKAAWLAIDRELRGLYAEAGKTTPGLDGKPEFISVGDSMKAGRLQALQRRIYAEYLKLAKKDELVTERTSTESYQNGAYGTQWSIDQQTRSSVQWAELNPAAVQYSVDGSGLGYNYIKTISKNTNQAIQKLSAEVSRAIITGDDYAKLADRVKELFGGSAYNAMRVIRTEAGRCYSEAEMAQYAEAESIGIPVKKMWVASLDDRTRDNHGQLDGTFPGEDGFFDLGDGVRTQAPRMSGDPSNDIQCRCSLVTIVDGDMPETRRIKDEGIVPYQTYSQWRES